MPNWLAGYGMHVRSLREEDCREYKVDLGNSDLDDCLAVEGEDLARTLTAVVDVRNLRLVWSDIPMVDDNDAVVATTIDKGIEAEWVRSLVFVVSVLFPWIRLPLPEYLTNI